MASSSGFLVALLQEMGYTSQEVIKNSAFRHRLRVQKAAFLLNHLGIRPFTNYEFNIYLRGPYSPQLAREYYNLEGAEPSPLNLGAENRLLLSWFLSHNDTWLEVASSVLSIKERYP